MIEDFLPSFPPAASSTLKLLNKLDVAFASLVTGKSFETGEPLPGFEKGSVVSMTEKVRIKSLVDQTKIVAVRVLGNEDEFDYAYGDDENDGDDEDEEDTEDDMDKLEAEEVGGSGIGIVTKHEMRIAKVYDRTIGILGKELGGSPIGIITDE
jgi:hypothetical protein